MRVVTFYGDPAVLIEAGEQPLDAYNNWPEGVGPSSRIEYRDDGSAFARRIILTAPDTFTFDRPADQPGVSAVAAARSSHPDAMKRARKAPSARPGFAPPETWRTVYLGDDKLILLRPDEVAQLETGDEIA